MLRYYAFAYSYAYVGPVFTGHKRCYAFAYAYVTSENQALVIHMYERFL